jgi:hypothetical protein
MFVISNAFWILARDRSLDHLFVDQDGIPTLVEVKRSTDTRIRREVVGQMLDYAANAVAYWPVETIRSQFERTCETRRLDGDQVLREFLTDGQAVEPFWQSVKTNLQAGRIRMLFVADQIPPELKRCRSPKLHKAVSLVRVTMLQASPHVRHFKRILDFGEGQDYSLSH